jgi:hypothetical protein
MTAHISYGQLVQDSINQFSIKQSIKCFEEQKSLKVIIQQKDSIIMAYNEYSQITRKTLVKQRDEAIIEKEVAETKAIKLQNKNYLLTTALVVESILLGLMIIF